MKSTSLKKSIFSFLVIGMLTAACSDGRAVDAIALEQKKGTSGKTNKQELPESLQNNDDGKSSIGSQPNINVAANNRTETQIELTTSLVDGIKTVDAETIRQAQIKGHSNEAIIAEILNSSLVATQSAIASLGMSKFLLSQYGASIVEGVKAMGLTAVDRARSAGLKDSEIIVYAKLQGISFGESALAALGLSKFILKNQGASDVEGVLAMGLPAIERARAAGLKDSEIIAYAKLQSVFFGEKALSALGLSKFILKNQGASDVEGVLAMGLPAIERARTAGLKDSEIIAYAKLQSVFFGEKALSALGLSKFILKNHGAQEVNGVLAMGLPAIERARAAGLKDSEIIAYAKLQSVFFGEKALASLGV